MGSFFRGIADFFKTDVYPRTTEIVISTYEKAVQHFHNRTNEAGEKFAPSHPFITFDPSLDFEPEERAGRFLHGYPQFSNKFSSELYKPDIYKDDNITISPVLNYYRGRFEMIIWCSSVYEMIDNRILTYQFFGGTDRPIQPKNIYAYLILDDALTLYRYNNRYSGESYALDWTNTEIDNVLIKNINQNKYVFPFYITPRIKLVGVGDASEKYGSGDELSDYKLSVEMEWECAIPTHLVLISQEFPDVERFVLEIDTGAEYVTSTTTRAPSSIIGFIPPSDSTSGSENVQTVDLSYDKEFNYILTTEDAEKLLNNENVEITLLESLDNVLYCKVYGKFGELKNGLHFTATTNTIVLYGFAITGLSDGDSLSIVYYTEN
jgi:hypothetical protein